MTSAKITILVERKDNGGSSTISDEEFECNDGLKGVRTALIGWLRYARILFDNIIDESRLLDLDEITNAKSNITIWKDDVIIFEEYFYIEGQRKYLIWGIESIIIKQNELLIKTINQLFS